MPCHALERADVFDQQSVIFGRRHAGKDELFALLSQAAEVKQRPDNRDQQRQADQAKSYENQAVKRSWAVEFHVGSVALA